MTLLSTIFAFVIALGLLITFHEFGHYLVARWCGVKVLRFSLGFGQPLFKKRLGNDQTEWVVAAIPLGGYVKMLDEREGRVPADELPRAFNRQPVSKRFAIVVAGPVANFLLAILLYWLLFILGVSGVKPILGEIEPATLAASAGFRNGDTITGIGDQAITTWQEARLLLLDNAVDKNPDVRITVTGESGISRQLKLDMSSLGAEDLESDFLNRLGLSVYRPIVAPVIDQVMVGGAAERAGLKTGDRVVAINGKEVSAWEDVVDMVRSNPGHTLSVEVMRDDRELAMSLQPETVSEGHAEIGKAGITPEIHHEILENLLVKTSYPPMAALVKAATKTWEMSYFTVRMLGKMVTGDVSLKNISGPITIANYAGQSAQIGFTAYLGFLALISISLGVLNLLPIPVLDGGHLMYYLIEVVRGIPLSERVMYIGNQIGMALLITLMMFAIYNDLLRLASE
ncbi:RIP metalloprotease RseP [Nitrosomonas eutropha]|uniref:Zinc metalloprotease n=2 Tax=Nitrosomonas eutropha TaxID=916 RepID=A0ABX5MD10_9PROT|nr:RIP metalloprotease RseP [Nitrosomonas eutropha]ABI60251.1 putative membrane-associated zinc metalloprotease [Nitrosomonas eutropha C91]PXV81709.1 regulator of sigma E protease [Nitrosomonas eutropha]SEI71923.1 regulator of sigma E protease [Nitrosomonas eutropha]